MEKLSIEGANVQVVEKRGFELNRRPVAVAKLVVARTTSMFIFRIYMPVRDGNQDFAAWKESYSYWHSIVNSPNETVHKCLFEFEQRYLPDYRGEVRYVKIEDSEK